MNLVSKEELTQTLIEQLPEELRPSLIQAMNSWWVNIRKTGGFRLTDHGYFIISKCIKIREYDFLLLDFKLTPKNLSVLDRKLKFPYYIKTLDKTKKSIIMFNEREAVLYQIYDDIDLFLKNYGY